MIQVREYARLTTSELAEPSLDCGIVSQSTMDWILSLAADWKAGEPVALADGKRSLKWGSYVGYLQSPAGEGIEILPKTGLGVEQPQKARKLLQRMLMAVMGIKPRSAGAASLMRMNEPLHEWIFAQFLGELKLLVARGLRFDYCRVEEESRFIRGQLRVAAQQRQPPGRGHLFQISHDIYSPNRVENRLLKTALTNVLKACKSNENWRLANELAHQMAEIPEEREPLRALANWRSSKLLLAYEAIKPWCSLILEQLNPNFQQGSHQGIALLFPMEQLFEKYVEVSLRRSLPGGSKLQAQASSEFLLRHQPEGSDLSHALFQLQPDLVLRGSEGAQVLDTKWKLIEQAAWQSDRKYNIAQADLYQMFAYGHKYQAGHGHMMLIYPSHTGFTRPLPPFHYSESLVIWVVPFCLESSRLQAGEWQAHFNLVDEDFMITGRAS